MDDDTPTVVALGDSLTAGHVAGGPGAWWPRYAPYTDVLEARFPTIRVVNSGVDGDLVTGMLGRLDRDLFQHGPSLVVVLGGTNDLGWGRSTGEIARDLARLYDLVAAASVDLIACTVPPLMHFPQAIPPRHALNAMIRVAAEERGFALVDLFTPLADPADGSLDGRWSSDGLHLNAAGYRVMGEVIAPVVGERLFG